MALVLYLASVLGALMAAFVMDGPAAEVLGFMFLAWVGGILFVPALGSRLWRRPR